MLKNPSTQFSLFAPPYRTFLPLDPKEGFASDPLVLRGVTLVWNMERGISPLDIDRAEERPPGIALALVLPRASAIPPLRNRVFDAIERARPQSIFPYHPRLDPEELEATLCSSPERLAEEVLEFLMWRGMYLDRDTRRILTRTIDLSSTVTTLTALARRLYLSRRALGRRFRKRGLPVPSHWLQFCRLLRGCISLQESRDTLPTIARALNYPDGFTFSNQMKRLVGVRPMVARTRLGWEWFLESWIQREWATGGLRCPLRGLRPRRQRKPVRADVPNSPPAGGRSTLASELDK